MVDRGSGSQVCFCPTPVVNVLRLPNTLYIRTHLMTPYFQTRVELHHISFDVVASADYDPVQEVEEEEAESFPHSKPESFAITT